MGEGIAIALVGGGVGVLLLGYLVVKSYLAAVRIWSKMREEFEW